MKIQLILLIPFLIIFFNCSSNSQGGKDPQDGIDEYKQIYQVYQKGDDNSATKMLEDYVQKYPNNYRGWTFYGIVLLKQEQDSLAEVAFKEALSFNPNIKQALTGLGVINRSKQNYQKAEEYYVQSIKLDPNFPEAYSSLIVIELIKKDFDEAIEYGEIAWSLDDKNKTIAANLSIAYHFKGDFKLRDKFAGFAEQLGYQEMDVLNLVFSGKKTLDNLLNINP